MATSVFELFASVNLDDREYRRSLDQAERATQQTGRNMQRDWDRSLRRMQDRLDGFGRRLQTVGGTLSRSLTAPIAAAGAAAVVATTRMADLADQVDKGAQGAGVSAEAYQTLRFAFEQNGINAKEFDLAIQSLNRRLGLAAQGNETYAKAYRQLGVDIRDANGAVRSSEDVILDVIDRLSELPSAAEQAAQASIVFGDDVGKRLVPALQGGAAGIEELRQQARDMGLVMQGESIDSLVAWKDELSGISQQFQIAGVEIAAAFLPIVRSLVDWVRTRAVPAMQGLAARLESLTEWWAGLSEGTQRFLGILGGVAVAAGPAVFALGTISRAVGTLVGVVRGLRTALLFLSGPAGLIAGLATVVGGVAFEAWRRHRGAVEENLEATRELTGSLQAVSGDTDELRGKARALGDELESGARGAFDQFATVLQTAAEEAEAAGATLGDPGYRASIMTRARDMATELEGPAADAFLNMANQAVRQVARAQEAGDDLGDPTDSSSVMGRVQTLRAELDGEASQAWTNFADTVIEEAERAQEAGKSIGDLGTEGSLRNVVMDLAGELEGDARQAFVGWAEQAIASAENVEDAARVLERAYARIDNAAEISAKQQRLTRLEMEQTRLKEQEATFQETMGQQRIQDLEAGLQRLREQGATQEQIASQERRLAEAREDTGAATERLAAAQMRVGQEINQTQREIAELRGELVDVGRDASDLEVTVTTDTAPDTTAGGTPADPTGLKALGEEGTDVEVRANVTGLGVTPEGAIKIALPQPDPDLLGPNPSWIPRPDADLLGPDPAWIPRPDAAALGPDVRWIPHPDPDVLGPEPSWIPRPDPHNLGPDPQWIPRPDPDNLSPEPKWIPSPDPDNFGPEPKWIPHPDPSNLGPEPKWIPHPDPSNVGPEPKWIPRPQPSAGRGDTRPVPIPNIRTVAPGGSREGHETLAGLDRVSQALEMLARSMEEEAGRLQTLTPAIQGLIGPFNELQAAWKEGAEGFAFGFGQVMGPLGAIANVIATLLPQVEGFDQLMEALNRLIQPLLRALEPLINAFVQLVEALQPIFDVLGALMAASLQPLVTLLSAVVVPVVRFFASIIEWAANVIIDVYNFLLGWLLGRIDRVESGDQSAGAGGPRTSVPRSGFETALIEDFRLPGGGTKDFIQVGRGDAVLQWDRGDSRPRWGAGQNMDQIEDVAERVGLLRQAVRLADTPEWRAAIRDELEKWEDKLDSMQPDPGGGASAPSRPSTPSLPSIPSAPSAPSTPSAPSAPDFDREAHQPEMNFGGTPQAVQLAVATPLVEASNTMMDAATLMQTTLSAILPGESGTPDATFGDAVSRFGDYVDRLVDEGIRVNLPGGTGVGGSVTSFLRSL